MTQSIIDIGDAPNDGTGDPVREAFNKCNNNFTELYAADAAGGGSTTTPVSPQGRLTLQTGTPVMTTTQSAKTTIFYTPYVGNQVPIYDGTNMAMTTFAELSVATTDTTKSPAAIGASKVNDWFVWNDAGTVRLGHGPDWTSDTVRSAGTALTMVNGIWLNNAAITNGPAASRGTYVGTTRSNASSQLDWIYGAANTAAVFNVWNAYNRVSFSTMTFLSTAWTYSSTTYREAGGATTYEIRYVVGLSEDGIYASYCVTVGNGAPATLGGMISIGVDSSTTLGAVACYTESNAYVPLLAVYAAPVSLGYHFLAAVERMNGSGAIAFNVLNNTNALTCQLQA